MAIEASAILPADSLEELRVQFNNLITDVDGISSGNSFVSSIIFEGATADANETVLFATDPTADRVITLPDVTGTVITTRGRIPDFSINIDCDSKIFVHIKDNNNDTSGKPNYYTAFIDVPKRYRHNIKPDNIMEDQDQDQCPDQV